MFNPFIRLEKVHIERLLRDNKPFLVSQSYRRGEDHTGEDEKINILFTSYEDLSYARIHESALVDKYKAILDLRREAHKKKVEMMLCDDSMYRTWWAVVKSNEEVNQRLNRRFTENIKRFIRNNTSWRIAGDEVIRPAVEVTYGEIFVNLKRGGQRLRVKLEEIEKA